MFHNNLRSRAAASLTALIIWSFILIAGSLPADAYSSKSAAKRAAQAAMPASDPQAVVFAAQSIAALTNGTSINDVTLTGSVIWTVGSDTETGTGTLLALGTGESRMNLALKEGTRSEIRDASTGRAIGQWIAPNVVPGLFASQNCATDAAWFFPALGSLTGGPGVVFLYIGQETRNGVSVQHLQTYQYQATEIQGLGPTLQVLSTMDFYLDATTLLPTAIVYNAHPDDNALYNIPIEVDFSEYQAMSGVTVPTHIQRYLQGTLAVDFTVTNATFNTGLTNSTFAI